MKTYCHKVQYYETDGMRITHHSNYVRFMEEARTDCLEQIGWSYKKFEEEGIVSPVVSVTCNYKKPTTYADCIMVNVELLELKKIKFKVGYTMTVNDEVVFTGTSVHCFMDRNGQPVNLESQYPEFYNKLLELKKNR